MTKELQPAIDWEACNNLANNNNETAGELLSMFVNDLPNVIDQFLVALDKEDFSELNAQAHKLHGATCYVGVPNLKTLIAQFESSMDDDSQQKLDIAQDHLSAIIDECTNIVDQFYTDFPHLYQGDSDAH